MAEARDRQHWNHTASVLCLIANVNRDPKKTQAFQASDFHPYETRQSSGGVPITAKNIGALRGLAKRTRKRKAPSIVQEKDHDASDSQ
jgi:hypothetical protein